jgi:hypothetical protein
MPPPRRSRSSLPLLQGAILAALAAGAIGWDLHLGAPPRFDGAGYAVLAEALRSGHSYREIDHPDQPPHAHYPPGYPVALALLWAVTGRSVAAARVGSVVCTTAATLLAWWWLRGIYPARGALILGVALAVNWTWIRAGGEVQSEPLFFLLQALALLSTVWAARWGSLRRGVVLGLVLAACALTRHVGLCLALASGWELILRRRRATVVAAMATVAVLVAPWVIWLATVQHNTQVALLARGSLPARIASNAWFYVLRLPDQITGPLVEIGTVFGRSAALALVVMIWAVLASGVTIFGWLRASRMPRRRLAARVPLLTLGLLLVWPFTEAGRFLIPLVPFLLVGMVEGMVGLAAVLGLRRRTARPWAMGLVLAASIPYSAYRLATDKAGAEQRAQADFDAACAWIAQHGDHPGPVLTRQPGEVFWLTGRRALLPPDDERAIDQAVDHYGVAYLFVDEQRYAQAPASPLARYVADHPDRVELVRPGTSEPPVAVYAVRSPPPFNGEGPRR